MAKLRQMNVQFVPQEDRLILRVRSDDDSEIRAWLTRRFTRLLLGILQKILAKEQPRTEPVSLQSAMQSFRRDAALIGADFATPYDSSTASHPLGVAPVMLSTIKYQRTDQGIILLTLGMPDGKTISLQLDRNLLHVLIKLLEDGANSAEWEVGALPQPEGTLSTPVVRTVH
ncbi:MAG: hypothetical protein KJ558_07180 [Gammaproteobacteria bacterium]|nr:hypothetical protein [Gammaproteobacteria bacterium]MBU1654599.1 hypothetical protein [Gammaproteobacteria bacterium]MBU1962327.1 hypothetical protein [Gammaproteobacteria bacterium]